MPTFKIENLDGLDIEYLTLGPTLQEQGTLLKSLD